MRSCSLFDPHFVTISSERLSLPAALGLTAALRGLLMRNFPERSPPEWLSGHRPGERATAAPHMALATLAFAGSRPQTTTSWA